MERMRFPSSCLRVLWFVVCESNQLRRRNDSQKRKVVFVYITYTCIFQMCKTSAFRSFFFSHLADPGVYIYSLYIYIYIYIHHQEDTTFLIRDPYRPLLFHPDIVGVWDPKKNIFIKIILIIIVINITIIIIINIIIIIYYFHYYYHHWYLLMIYIFTYLHVHTPFLLL